jgi:outer membrane protein OmpA-like peptidoglycan-associated protein
VRVCKVWLAMVLVLPALRAYALSGEGTTAATFLKIGVGPRAVAMGEAYTGVADDPSAVYWNPAGIAQIPSPAVTAMHAFWLQSTYFEHLAGTLPLPAGVVGFSLIYLNAGDLLRSEEGDTPDSPFRGTFSANNLGFTAAYAYPYDASLCLGGAVKTFSETIDGRASVGWAADLAFLYRLPWKAWKLGGAAQNLGPATRLADNYARLPANLKLGVSWQALPRLLLDLDYNQLLEQNGKISLGAEYVFEKILALRAGYHYQSAVDNFEYYDNYGTNTLSGVTAGVGIFYQEFHLDYAFVPYGMLGSAHRISLTYELPAPAPTATATTQPTPVPAAPTPAPTPAPAVKAQAVELEQKIERFTRQIVSGKFAKVQFASGKADLTPASLKTLKEISRLLGEYPGLTVRIEGHTDSLGVADDNLKLSQRRVDAVKAYLVEKAGLDGAHLQAVGFGQTQPVASNQTKAGRSQNRRVEFKVVTQVVQP